MQIQGYPTLKFYVDGKPTDYDGPRSADGIVDYVLRKFRNVKMWLFRSPMKGSEEDLAVVTVTVDTATGVTQEALTSAT